MAEPTNTGSINPADDDKKLNDGTQPVNTGQTGTVKTFTQDEVNDLIGERAKRAKEAARKEILESLGFEKLDDLKGVVSTFREQQAAQKSELEKAQETLSETQRKLAEQERKRVDGLINAEVLYRAAQMNFVNPKEALRLIDISQVNVGDDDVVTGVEEALKALAEASPHLLKSDTGRRAPNLGATNPAGQQTGPSPIITKIKERMGGPGDTSIFALGGGVVASKDE